MPIFNYECPNGHSHDELKKVEDRASDPCPECGATATLVIVPVHLDVLNTGTDPGFPTAAEKWAKMHERVGSGKQWDSNNLRYGGEYERKR